MRIGQLHSNAYNTWFNLLLFQTFCQCLVYQMATSNIASCHKRGTNAKQCSLFTQAKLLNCFRKLFWVHVAKKIEKIWPKTQFQAPKHISPLLLLHHPDFQTCPPRNDATREGVPRVRNMPYDAVRKIYMHRDGLTNMCTVHVPAGVHILEIVWNKLK